MTSGRRHPLSRGHHIPLRRQLAADLEAGIRDGHIRPGTRLPSSRDLARRLALDRGTVSAAFARLRRRGLLDTGAGRRPGVPEPDEAERLAHTDSRVLDAQAVRFAKEAVNGVLQRASQMGVPRRALLEELSTVVPGSLSSENLTLFEPRPGLRAVLASELASVCGLQMEAVDDPRLAPESGPVLLRREVFDRLRRPTCREFVPIRLAGGTRERGLVRRRVRKGLVVLLSASGHVRRYAEELAAREFERGVSFAAIDPDADPVGLVRLLDAARMIFYDGLSARHVAAATVATIPIQLLGPQEGASLRRYLGTSGFVGPNPATRRPGA